jgi:tetratricopeptide (TPR) repeat protein
LALALACLGRYDDAEHHAREAIREYPPGASGWIALAEAHLGRAHYDEALDAAKRGCDLWSSAWEAWDVLVRVHLACGDRAGAQKAYDDAIATNSRAPRILRLRALL